MSIWRAADRTRRRPAGVERSARVREELDRAELLLLAHYGSRPAGMLLAETYREDGVPDPATGHLSMVHVDPAVWGCRVGSALVRDLQQRSWSRLSAWSRTDNRRALGLLRATGFVDTGNRTHLQDGDELAQLTWPPAEASPFPAE